MTKQPSYRFAGYTESWEEKKLGEVSTITMGQSPNSENYTVNPNDYILVQGNADMKNGRVFPRVWTTQITKQARQGDLILSVRAPVGDIGKTDYDVVLGRGVASIDGNEFLYQALSQMKQNGYWSKLSTGSTFESINSNDIKSAIISLPSLPEQTAIGSLFQDIDQLISLQQRKLEVLKEQKKTYLKLLFPAKGQTKPALRFAGFEDEWKEVKLGEVFDIVTDYVANGSFESLRNNVKTYEKDNFAYMIRLQDASNSWKGPWLYTDEKGYNFLSKSRLFKDDILMSNVGTVGRFFQVPELDRPMTLAPNSVLIRSTSSNNQFLYFMMLTANIQDQIAMRKTPGVQDKINKTDFKKVIATLPTLPEQEAIGSFFQDLDKVIAKQEEKVNQLKESKQTLLRKMFI